MSLRKYITWFKYRQISLSSKWHIYDQSADAPSSIGVSWHDMTLFLRATQVIVEYEI